MNPNDPPCTTEDRAAIVRAADSIVADALRYRFLRDICTRTGADGDTTTVFEYDHHRYNLDSAIDAALLQLTEGA